MNSPRNPENIVSFPDQDRIEDEAGQWIARMDTRALTAEERAELSRWEKQSPRHREALERMAAVWGGADILAQLSEVEPVDDGAEAWRPSRRAVWAGAALAASLVLMASVGLVPSRGPDGARAGDFATAIGEQETIALADGSTVTLNTNSEIRIDLTRKERSVRLVKGEAHFKVAKDQDRPFLVYANDGAVRAVGTAFSVHLRDASVEVTVDEGVVELLAGKRRGPGANETPPLAALAVNESAVFSDRLESHEKLSGATVERKLLWREGMIGFAGEPLSEVIAEVSRYTDVAIRIEDPALEETPIGGFFRAGDLDGLFDALETVFNVEAEWVGPGEVRLTRAA